MEISFNGKTALVTGAAGGIGSLLTSKLVTCGAKVFALDVDEKSLEVLSNKVPGIKTICVDLSNWESTKEAGLSCGDVDLLVNCAGILINRPLGSIDEEHFNSVINVNLKAAINLSQVVAENIKKRGSTGAIVNISSQLSHSTVCGGLAYCVSKAGLDMVTKVLATEYGPYQIRANAVNPTLMYTRMGIKVAADNPKIVEDMLTRIPLGRMTGAQNVVDAILFLLSDKAEMINGVTLPVDGGFKVT